MLSVPMVNKGGQPNPSRLDPGDTLAGAENILNGSLTTVGNGTWTAAMIAAGIIRRTGPVGGYTDTTDTAANILTALAGNAPYADMKPGSTFRMLFINTVAQALTFAAGTGVVSGTGTLTVAASLWREYLWTILNAMTPVTVSGTITNATAVVTFQLPPNVLALPIGPNPSAINITPGATITSGSAGISAGTTVLGITQGQGGITGVTMNANATASGVIALTFGPTIQIDSLRSGTL